MKFLQIKFSSNSFCLQFVHPMLYKGLDKIVQGNAFEQDKKKPGLKFKPLVSTNQPLNSHGPRSVVDHACFLHCISISVLSEKSQSES